MSGFSPRKAAQRRYAESHDQLRRQLHLLTFSFASASTCMPAPCVYSFSTIFPRSRANRFGNSTYLTQHYQHWDNNIHLPTRTSLTRRCAAHGMHQGDCNGGADTKSSTSSSSTGDAPDEEEMHLHHFFHACWRAQHE
ncbi:hypothetical protein B0H14DRAFT_2562341 [Mycena olivaceomarginata]|nr:hypothetical protein B0H14DRAFT_2562341 [Mycena olivaceomarginata]